MVCGGIIELVMSMLLLVELQVQWSLEVILLLLYLEIKTREKGLIAL